MIRLAIAGLGAVTRNIHLPAYARLEEKVVLVGGCDVQTEARANFAKWHPAIPPFCDFTEMLRATKPTVVAICTPPFLHHGHCLEALRQGCHVFSDKPLVA